MVFTDLGLMNHNILQLLSLTPGYPKPGPGRRFLVIQRGNRRCGDRTRLWFELKLQEHKTAGNSVHWVRDLCKMDFDARGSI